MKVHVSCFVDSDPKFVIQAYNWVVSLRSSGSTATPFICVPDNVLSEHQWRSFETLGAQVVAAKRFGEGRAAYCNKISQLFVDEVLDCDYLVLSDADIGFLAPPEQAVNGAQLRAKPVDLPNPPAADIEAWLKAIGMAWFGDAETQFAHGQGQKEKTEYEAKGLLGPGQQDKTLRRTLAHNYNGGLYVIRRDAIQQLREAWSNYSAKLLDAAPLGAGWAKHADQIGFACAVHDLGLKVSELESGWNFPTHLNVEYYHTVTDCPELCGLHYHSRMDNHGLPEEAGVPWLDDSINMLREVIRDGRRACFDNEIFWNYRYKYFPDLGSGLGSRGAALNVKKELSAPAFGEMTGFSVVDVGCGDLEFVRDLNFGDYLGLDLSEQAIATAKAKRPEWSFRHSRIDTLDDASFDFALCLDVLIHQPTRAAAEALVDDLLRVARKGVLLSIHSEQQTNSNISFNTYAIRNYLRDHPDTRGVIPLGQYRDAEILAVSKEQGVFDSIMEPIKPELA